MWHRSGVMSLRVTKWHGHQNTTIVSVQLIWHHQRAIGYHRMMIERHDPMTPSKHKDILKWHHISDDIERYRDIMRGHDEPETYMHTWSCHVMWWCESYPQTASSQHCDCQHHTNLIPSACYLTSSADMMQWQDRKTWCNDTITTQRHHPTAAAQHDACKHHTNLMSSACYLTSSANMINTRPWL